MHRYEWSTMTRVEIDKWVLDVSPDDRPADVAVCALKARLGAVRHWLSRAAQKEDHDNLEGVHQLRVWTRRAAAAMKLFDPFLPRRRAAWLRKQLKRLRGAANEARDLDVLVERLAREWSESQDRSSMNELRDQRSKSRQPIADIYDRLIQDDQFERRIAKLLKGICPRGPTTAQLEAQRFGDWARDGLNSFVTKFFEAAPGRDADSAALHKFRVRGKRLRYAMELLAGAFSDEFRDKLYPVIETLQDELGELNDHATAQGRLQKQLKKEVDPREIDHLRRVRDYEAARFEVGRQEFLNWCTSSFLTRLRAEFDQILSIPKRMT
jgi:CHAD domain-containing protein